MNENRLDIVQRRMNLLIDAFPVFIDFYEKDPPFSKYGQLEHHCKTIKYLRASGSAVNAIQDDKFLKSLYETLKAWGIGVRGSKLAPFSKFKEAILDFKPQINELDGISIDKLGNNVSSISSKIWRLIEEMDVVYNKAKVVACTKTLHHILPDLVVPIDRQYTQAFFNWQGPVFQYEQSKCFKEAFMNFERIARSVAPQKYVGSGWNTSRTKIIDNAIVGLFVAIEEISKSSNGAG